MYCMDLTLLAHKMVAQGISYHEGCATDDGHGRVFVPAEGEHRNATSTERAMLFDETSCHIIHLQLRLILGPKVSSCVS